MEDTLKIVVSLATHISVREYIIDCAMVLVHFCQKLNLLSNYMEKITKLSVPLLLSLSNTLSSGSVFNYYLCFS